MVDSGKRFAAADSPRNYEKVSEWLAAVTTLPGVKKSGLQAGLAAYMTEVLGEEVSNSLVGSWIKRGNSRGSLPELPRLRVIAEWARVEFNDLKWLHDKEQEERQAIPRKRAGGRPTKAAKKFGSQGKAVQKKQSARLAR